MSLYLYNYNFKHLPMDTQYELWLEEQHDYYINQVIESGLPLYMLDMYECDYSLSNPALNKPEDKNSHLLTLTDFNRKGLALNYMEWFKCDLGNAYKKYLMLNTVRSPDPNDDPVLPQDTYDGETDDLLPF